MSSVMFEQKLSGKSWLKICSSRWTCSPPPPPPPPPQVGNWTGFAKKDFHFFHSENQMKKKISYILLGTVTTLILRSDEVMKFCVEAAVSAAQGRTAVGPPPPHRKLDQDLQRKNFHFFHSEINCKKNFVAGKSVCCTEANPSSCLVRVIATEYWRKRQSPGPTTFQCDTCTRGITKFPKID